MASDTAKQLIGELIADPRRFDKEGRAYQLLQCYFDGYPRETLRPLLNSGDAIVRRAAAFIVSELGADARDLIDDIVRLMHTGDRYLKYQAMEALTVCAEGEQADKFAYVPRELENADEVLRALAMRLIANADAGQLRAAARSLSADSRWEKHSRALAVLANEDALGSDEILEMLGGVDAVVRRYGAIAARRFRHSRPQLASAAASTTKDPELRDYLLEE